MNSPVRLDSLKCSTRCGFQASKARQILEIAVCDIPTAAAIDLVDHCVALCGCSSTVSVTITAFNLGVADRARCTGARLIPQSIEPPLRKASAPFARGHRMASQRRGDPVFGVPSARSEHDAPAAQRQRPEFRCRSARPPFQRLTLIDRSVQPPPSGRPSRVLMDTPASDPTRATPRCTDIIPGSSR